MTTINSITSIPRLGGVGVGWQNMLNTYNPKLIGRARNLRKNSTLSEILLWNRLKNRQLLNHKFRRQETIGNYIVDFYCKELKLAIEIDGFSHDFKIEYDKARQDYLEKLGLTIHHINDLDVKKDIETVIQRIVDVIETSER